MIGIGQRSYLITNLVLGGGDNLTLPECDLGKFNCPFLQPVFADGSGDDLKNDKSSIIKMFQTWTTAAVFTLQKNEGVWTDQATITDDTYGEYYSLAYWDEFPKYTGLVIYWNAVLSAFGEGEYRIQVTETNPTGDFDTYTESFCLQTYNCSAADNTVRLEWYQNNGIGDIDNDRNVLDFGNLNWYSQLRIPHSIFGYPKSSYEVERIDYTNGESQDITNVQTEKYTLTIGLAPAYIHNIIKTFACQADQLFITDYSTNNPQTIIRKSVKLTSEYAPKWFNTSKCAPVKLEFEPKYNRLERFRCI